MDLVEKAIGAKGKSWTATPPLPGGDFAATGFEDLVTGLAADWPDLDRALLRRLARAYGTKTRVLLAGVKTPQDLGLDFGAGLSEREVAYMMDHEWARTAEDVLWRRSKLGLAVDEAGAAQLGRFIAERLEKVA
jgi:glycerol-3-phosphate dehydrogenase